MASLLALDWDNREFHLVEATVGRGKVHILRAVSWREEEPFLPANAEQFGERLSEQMKKAGIAPAPVIIGLGRDRMVVKEVRYPQVPEDVEAAVVRNQITKDLTESPEEVFLDYAPMSETGPQGERRALSLVVRKDMVQGLQNLCRAAGLKLLAVTARPFGIAACFKHLAGHTPQVPAPPAPDAVAAVLTVSGTWAEFCATRGRQLLFARSLAVGDGMLGEVRRNLAAYSGQPQLSFPRDAIQALYVSGNGENAVLREKLQETLGIPVYGLDPFAKEERVDVEASNRAGFTGAVGLLHLWAADQATPVNFVKPRESKQRADPTRKRVVAYGVLGVLAVACVIFGAYWTVGQKHAQMADLQKQKMDVDKELKDLKPDIMYMEALKEWRESALPWIDELYDLSARTPYEKGFRIKSVTAVPLAGKAAKDRFTARMTITGEAEAPKGDKADPVETLMQRFNKDKQHCKCIDRTLKQSSTGPKVEFTLEVDINFQPPSAYTTPFVLPSQLAQAAKKAEPDDEY